MNDEKCEKCNEPHNGLYGSGRFCTSKCARGFSTQAKRTAINKKVSNKLKGHAACNKVARIAKKCKHCKIIMHRRPNDPSQFCSKKCFHEFILLGKTEYEHYKIKCKFKFNVYKYPENFDLTMIDTHGWYKARNRGNNPNGISRDHMYSIKEGFINNVSPDIISHPANCNLLRHRDNQKKNTKCSITLNELTNKLKVWPRD